MNEINQDAESFGFLDFEVLSEELEQESMRYSRKLAEEEEAV